MAGGLILLDRDGVLNRVVVDPEHGTIDSPLHPDQVDVFPWVPASLLRLQRAGFVLAIVSNQPGASKGKTTRENLERVHERVLAEAQQSGARIASSHLCFHRAEDGCRCRKPGTALLEDAFARNPGVDRAASWMVGDGVTDIEAGARFSLRTAFLGPRKCDACRVFEDRKLSPTLWVADLADLSTALTGA